MMSAIAGSCLPGRPLKFVFGARWLRRWLGMLVVAGSGLLAGGAATFEFERSRWVGEDIGGPVLAGSEQVEPTRVRVTAGGSGIGFRADQFRFVGAEQSGDFDVQVRVSELGASDLWAKAGIMVRDGTSAGAPFAGVFTTPSGAGCLLQVRVAAGGVATNMGTFPANQPFTYLRLRRVGSSLSGFAGYDGRRWTPLGTRTVNLGDRPRLGFAVTSHRTNDVGMTAEFREWKDVMNPEVAHVRVGLEPLGPSNRRTALVITEIMYHPADRADGRELEFVELYNSQPYFEDIGGWQLAGDVDFVFPPGTIIPGGGFLVVAEKPSDLAAVHGAAAGTVLGPYRGSLGNGGGELRLLGGRREILQEVSYEDRFPWPLLADGAGHSLVLARPSYGEGDPRAWAPSRLKGGSPGRPEAVEITTYAGVRFNEIQLPGPGNVGFIELIQSGPGEADLGGLRLGTTSEALPFVIPAGTHLSPGGTVAFTWAQAGLSPKVTGDTVFLGSPDGSRFVDATDVMVHPSGTSYGRWPNGGEYWRVLSAPTPGAGNARPAPGIVISEVHPRPPSGLLTEEFVELHNPGAVGVDLADWAFTGGIGFTFGTGTRLPAGGYLVVAADRTSFLAAHPTLDPASVVGDFRGRLSTRGDVLTLSRPVAVRNGNKTETVWSPVTTAVIQTGSRWSRWADAGGSTLELTDRRADATLAANWTASEESGRSEWRTVEFRGVLDNGAGNTRPDSLHIYVMGEGECLVDNVEVIGPGNTNRIANGTFETGTNGWVFSGNHVRSSLELGAGDGSSQSLHLRASGNGDTGANKVFARFGTALTVGNTATLRARVKWLRGWPEILLRLHGNSLEAYGRLDAPAAPGTPGASNSRATPNAGPAFDQVGHFPVVPAADEAVIVTARVDDPDGVGAVVLRYRTDPATVPTEVAMVDDGSGGDEVPGNGIYSAVIPAGSSARLVAFTLEARDAAPVPAMSVFPPASPASECLVRFGDPIPSGAFGTYRLWVSSARSTEWRVRPMLSNEPMDSTFVYGNVRAVYGAGGRFAGSPFHQQFSSGPTSDCHYVVEVPGDERLIGTSAFNKIHAPGNGPFDDAALQREQAVYWLARKSGLPWFYRRFVNMVVNGSKRRTLMEDTQVGSDDMVREYWPDDPDGSLFKIQPWFEFPDSTSQTLQMQNNTFTTISRFTTTGGQFKTARYRCNWLVRGADGTANDFTNVFALATAATDNANPNFEANLEKLIDVDAWFRAFAVNHAVGNWDSVGYNNGQNTYGYKPRNGRWELILWDANIVMGNGSDGPSGLPLFSCSDPTISRWFSTGSFRRRFRSAYYELANGPMTELITGPMMDAKYAAFQEHGISATAVSGLRSWLTTAKSGILGQLRNDTAPFAVTGIEGATSFRITGSGPLDMVALAIDGVTVPITWSGTRTWTATYSPPVPPARVVLSALNRFSGVVAGGVLDVRLTQPGSLTLRSTDTGWVLDYPATHAGEYRLEASDSLETPDWKPLATQVGSLGVLHFPVAAVEGRARFFRITEL